MWYYIAFIQKIIIMKFLNKLFISIITIAFFSTICNADVKKQQLDIDSFTSDLKNVVKVYSAIHRIYVDETKDRDLFDNAIKGMVGGLDPHSDYLKPKEQKELLESSSGKFGGLGIVISKKDNYIEVISPIDDTPAYRAGIKAGDLIIKIGNKTTREMSLEDGVKLMRGKPNTEVEITISRKGKKPKVYKITRDIITVISVKGYLLEKDLAYIRISSFQEPTANLFLKIFDKLTTENKSKLKSIILDLRNNPGGLLKGAINISDIFLNKKQLVVYTKGRIPSANFEFFAKKDDITKGAKLVVLINQGSASASEIVAGAIQDHKRGIIIGQQSFGKGSVQTIIDLPDGYGLKLTTARYYTPKGRSIQAKGITPDVELKNIELKASEDGISFEEKDYDNYIKANDDKKQVINYEEKIDEGKKQESDIIKKLKKDYFINEASNLLKALNIIVK